MGGFLRASDQNGPAEYISLYFKNGQSHNLVKGCVSDHFYSTSYLLLTCFSAYSIVASAYSASASSPRVTASSALSAA